jgi:hypothetical protein
MPSEPDNKMDDLLKTYAKKRRDEAGAPFELHPATRKLLQTEAAKLRPKALEQRQPWFSALLAFWPRYALTATAFVVLGIGAWTFFRFEEQPKRMALLDAEQKAPRPEPARLMETMKKKESDGRQFSEMARDERDSFKRQASEPRPAEQPVALREEAGARLKAVVDESKARQSVTELVANESLQKNLPASLPALAAPAAPPPVPAPITAPAPQPEKPVARNFAVTDSTDKGASVETAGAALAGGKAIAFKDAQRQNSQPPAAAGNGPLSRAADANAPAQQTSLAIAPQSPQPAGPAGNERFYSRPGAVAQTGQNATQSRNRFSQVQSNSRNVQTQQAAAAAPVLAEFDFEQTGNRVRVVDADGSVYDGLIIENLVKADQDSKEAARRDVAQTVKLKNASPRQNALAEGAPADSPAWNFRASGTNRTLQQAVTINAVFYANSTNLGGQAAQTARGTLQTTQQQPNATLPPVQRIQGRVQVGSGAETQLDAVRRGN